MKLTYWIAENLRDNRCYNVRARTRREVVNDPNRLADPTSYGEPTKVVVEYRDAFDLVRLALGEGGIE